jgi:hypothetical protein
MSYYKSISHIAVIGHDGRSIYCKGWARIEGQHCKEITLEWRAAHDKHFDYFNNKVGRGELMPGRCMERAFTFNYMKKWLRSLDGNIGG